MTKEIRSFLPVELRAAEDGSVKVSGYAAVFDQETNIGDYFIEVIERGAFTDAIVRDDVVFLINHEGLPLARTRSGTLQLSEDERGLKMDAMLDISDPDVMSIVPKMKRGDLDKMSFAFYPELQRWDESGDIPKRYIQKVRLSDVSIVTTPAYDGTEIGLRSLEAHRRSAIPKIDKKPSQSSRRMRMAAKLRGIDVQDAHIEAKEFIAT
jgi:HK97 family phage prohead protease